MNDTQLSYVAIQSNLVYILDLIVSRLYHDSPPSWDPHNGEEETFIRNLLSDVENLKENLTNLLPGSSDEKEINVPVQTKEQ